MFYSQPIENRTLCSNGKPTLSIVLLYMYILSKISHTLKSNQAPNGSSADYLIFLMYRYTKCQKIFKWNASLELIPHHLPWKRQFTYKLQNSISPCYVKKVMTESIRPLWEIMLTFSFLKSSGYMCNLRCQNETCKATFQDYCMLVSCFINEQEQLKKTI